jgi:CBS domain-containing protein
MDALLDLARRPAAHTRPDTTVREAAEMLMKERVGAAVVLDHGRLVGILSERDIVGRVVATGRDPGATLVRDIMTSTVRTARAGMKVAEALELMHDGNCRHLPLVDDKGGVVGMLSIRHLLRARVIDLDLQNADLVRYSSADGPGG